jgi:hypothetical protein
MPIQAREQGSAERRRPECDKAVANLPAPADEQVHGERSGKRTEPAKSHGPTNARGAISFLIYMDIDVAGFVRRLVTVNRWMKKGMVEEIGFLLRLVVPFLAFSWKAL